MQFRDSHTDARRVGYRMAIRVVNFSRGYTIALLLLVAVKENGFLQVKRDRRFITANPQRRAVLRRGTNISVKYKTSRAARSFNQVGNDLFLHLEIPPSLSLKIRFLNFLHFIALLEYQFRKPFS